MCVLICLAVEFDSLTTEGLDELMAEVVRVGRQYKIEWAKPTPQVKRGGAPSRKDDTSNIHFLNVDTVACVCPCFGVWCLPLRCVH